MAQCTLHVRTAQTSPGGFRNSNSKFPYSNAKVEYFATRFSEWDVHKGHASLCGLRFSPEKNSTMAPRPQYNRSTSLEPRRTLLGKYPFKMLLTAPEKKNWLKAISTSPYERFFVDEKLKEKHPGQYIFYDIQPGSSNDYLLLSHRSQECQTGWYYRRTMDRSHCKPHGGHCWYNHKA